MRGENSRTIYRTERKPGFAQIPNEALRDDRLSWRARGLLAYMLSFPDDWQHRADDLQHVGSEGRDAVRKALRELEEVGYRRRERHRGDDGKIRTFVVLRDYVPEDVTDAWKPVGRSTSVSVDQASYEYGHEYGHETPSGSDEQPKLVDVPKPKKERKRDPIFDALAAVFPNATKSEASLIGMAAAELKTLTPVPEPEEIIRRSRAARREWPTCTARAVAQRWTDLGALGAPASESKFDEFDDDYEERKGRIS